jgi:uncharacterized membrane-anchored protein
MTMRAPLFALAGFLILGHAALRADNPPPQHLSQDDMAAVASSLKWQTGTITLKDGLAKLDLAPGYRFLDGADSEKVLHDLWGNPPDDAPLGMIFPPGLGPLDRNGWGVLVEYEENGHVNDANAASINYSDLLKTMQQQVRDGNAQRQQEGYAPMELVGWAEPPHYDAATHKLYWAKDLRVGNDAANGLNYNIRVLGRKGVLVLNAIAGLDDLNAVSARMPALMAMVDFQPGNTYADFNPHIDKVAQYGIAALIAGGAVGVAAKVGLFKLLIPVLLALKKFLIIIIVAGVALIKKLVGAIKGRSHVERPFQPPPQGGSGQAAVVPPPRGLNPPPEPNREPLRPPPGPSSGAPPPDF